MKSKVFFKLLIVVVFLIGSANAFAQVRIGANADPDTNAMLDMRGTGTTENKGVLFPRVVLNDIADKTPFGGATPTTGMTVYNNGGTGLSAGLYVWNGTKWTYVNSTDSEWFYMPPTLIDTTVGAGKSINLFEEYEDYLDGLATKTSDGAPSVTDLLNIGTATDYYYYVIGYDTDTFGAIQISESGVMTYAIANAPTDATYINIIFVRK